MPDNVPNETQVIVRFNPDQTEECVIDGFDGQHRINFGPNAPTSLPQLGETALMHILRVLVAPDRP